MSKYDATIIWNRSGAIFTNCKYPRAYTWQLDDGED